MPIGAFVVLATWWLVGDEREPQPALILPAVFPVADPPRDLPSITTPASAPDVVAKSSEPDEVQMCGGAWAKLEADGRVDLKSVGAATRVREEALAAEVLAAMQSSADEATQAAAHAVGAQALWLLRGSLSACKGAAACEQNRAAAVKEGLAHRDALAKLAQGSVDPVVYGWAVQACNVRVPDAAGFCQLISAAQWARLDPTNAVPWVAAAESAQSQHDGAALEDAIFRIASAERYDPGEYRITAALLDHVPSGEDNLYAGFSLAARSIGVSAAQAAVEVQSLGAFCRSGDVADATRRDACVRIAEMLVKGSTTRNGLYAARLIGRRVGWSDDRFKELERETRALEAAATDNRTGMESLSCEYLQASVDRLQQFAALGEVQALRRLVAATPLPAVSSKSPGANFTVSTVRR